MVEAATAESLIGDNYAGNVRPIRFATHELAVSEQFEAWRDFMSSAIVFDLEERRDEGFAAAQTVWDLGGMVLTHAVMPSDGPVRTWRHLGKDPLDHWCLVLATEVRGNSGGEPNASRARSGRLHFRSLGSAFEGWARDENVISLYFPRDMFELRSSYFEGIAGSLEPSASSALLADYLSSLDRTLEDLTMAELPRIAEATRSMLAACLTPTREEIEAARDTLTVSLVERARKMILQDLMSPAMGPEFLARSLGISRSGLYRLFEPLGGVRHYIQRQRLLAAHAALSDNERDGPIIAIAEQYGFPDASGFSRAFRQEFGYSPSCARAAATLGAPFSASPSPVPQRNGDLAGVLRRLHA